MFLVSLSLSMDAIIGRSSRIKWYFEKNSQFNSCSVDYGLDGELCPYKSVNGSAFPNVVSF